MSDNDDNTTQERTPTPFEELAILLDKAMEVSPLHRYTSRDVNTGNISIQYTQTVTRSTEIALCDYMDSGYTDISEYVDYEGHGDWDDEQVEDYDEGQWQIQGYVPVDEYNKLVDIIIGLRKNLAIKEEDSNSLIIKVKHLEVKEE